MLLQALTQDRQCLSASKEEQAQRVLQASRRYETRGAHVPAHLCPASMHVCL